MTALIRTQLEELEINTRSDPETSDAADTYLQGERVYIIAKAVPFEGEMLKKVDGVSLSYGQSFEVIQNHNQMID